MLAPRPLLAVVGMVGVGALLLAAFLQHARGFEPCPWCVLQRLVLLVVTAFAWLGVALAGRAPALGRGAGVLALVFSLWGIAAALYQHFVAARSPSCALTLADRIVVGLGLPDLWPAMFEATARCDEADLPWLGVPFSLWGALTFLIAAGACALAIRPGTWQSHARP